MSRDFDIADYCACVTGHDCISLQQPEAANVSPDDSGVGELPWVALILNVTRGLNLVLGAGSLVHPRVVATAANKVAR